MDETKKKMTKKLMTIVSKLPEKDQLFILELIVEREMEIERLKNNG